MEAKERLAITGKKMTWPQAIEYARSKNLWIPTKAQSKEIKELDLDFWTSTTYFYDTLRAYSSNYKTRVPPSKTDVKDVVMVEELKGVDQDVTYHSGDIMDW